MLQQPNPRILTFYEIIAVWLELFSTLKVDAG